jgi:sulfur-oxidizing protein SoxY
MGPVVTRRAALALVAVPFAATADETDVALRELVGEGRIEDGGITLRVPAVAENGGQVPITVLVDSPQTAADHVAAIHILATRNPTPGIASFRLTPLLARAEVQTRMRLAEEQRIIVVAQMNDGRLLRASADIRVTTSGCLT